MLKVKNKKYRSTLKRIKIDIYNILENERSPLNHIYSIIAIILVIASSMTILFLFTPQRENLPPDLYTFLKNFEEISLIFFLVEYILRWWVISDFLDDFKSYVNQHETKNTKVYIKGILKALEVKFRWMIKPYSIIDFLAILPIIRPLRLLRIFQIIRIFKLIRYFNVFKNIIKAFKEQWFIFLFSFLMIFLNIFVLSLITYVYEYNENNKEFSSLWIAIYWGIITSFTVGYGDIVPISEVGRMCASIMTILNIIFISILTAGFSASFINKLLELKEGGIKMKDLKDHIVICGYNETSEEILKKIMENNIDKEKPVVLITNVDKKDLGIELSKYIIYKRGDFIIENNLLDIAIEKASDVIIVGEKLANLNERDTDARTALAGMLIKTLNPNCKLYVEVLLDEDAEIFKKRIKAREVLIHGQILGKILFSSILNPGNTNLIETLINIETGIRKIKVKEFGNVKNFKEVFFDARKLGFLPIALERNRKIILNPPDDFEILENDYIFLIPKGDIS